MLDIMKEIEFWTSILKDHAHFQIISLSTNEEEAIEIAEQFKLIFEEFNKKSKQNLTEQDKQNFIKENKELVKQFIEFKKTMLTKLMTCDIELAMTPTFLNHMINEALEFYRVLSIADETLTFNKVFENIRLHKVWLPDASGHAKFIASQLDGIETSLMRIAMEFMNIFDSLTKKANEMHSMFETTSIDQGGLNQFNLEVSTTMEDFLNYLETIKKLKMECKVYTTGTFSQLIPDHMQREESYYLSKINNLQ